MTAENYIGKKFNSLTIKDVAGRCKYGRSIVNVECECGVKKVVELYPIITGATKSCGCLKARLAKNNLDQTKHGLSRHKLHGLLSSIKKRCYNPNERAYKNYGGRGITVCDEWLSSYETFIKWALANGWQDGLQIDRENNNGNYEPSNCRFITNAKNALNKRTNRVLTYNSISLPLSEWARVKGLNVNTLRSRINTRKWSIDKSLNTKVS